MNSNQNNTNFFVSNLTDIILANLDNENFGVRELVRQSGMSRYTLRRKVHAHTGKTINQLIRETRLRKALELLINESLTVSEVAYQTGFGSATYFNTCFTEYFGFSPGAVKRGEVIPDPDSQVSYAEKKKNKKDVLRRTIMYTSVAILFIIIIVTLGNSIFQRNTDPPGIMSNKSENAIAVLPFKNLGNNPEDQSFLDGLQEEILSDLSSIKDLTVVSGKSSEQFRKSVKSASFIAKKLDVIYLITGSGQKYENSLRLRVQLIDAKSEKQIWAHLYDQEIYSPGDIFKVQSEVAIAIINKLKATLTPDEKKIIEKIPTNNLSAYTYYTTAKAEFNKYWSDIADHEPLIRSEELVRKAIAADSSFARAYLLLSSVYFAKYRLNPELNENYSDSAKTLADISLSYDNTLADAYHIKGYYSSCEGNSAQALAELEKALSLNKNLSGAYFNIGLIYLTDPNYLDYVKGLGNFHKAFALDNSHDPSVLLRELAHYYDGAGFSEYALRYYNQAFSLDHDTTALLESLGRNEFFKGNFSEALEFFLKGYGRDSGGRNIIPWIVNASCWSGKPEEALKYKEKYEKIMIESPVNFFYIKFNLLGYLCWQNGLKKDAEYWFKKQINLSKQLSDKKGTYLNRSSIDLAATYAVIGEKKKAFEQLRLLTEIKSCPWVMILALRYNPLLSSIRGEPEFSRIQEDLEDKYQVEYERVRKWLEAQGQTVNE